MDITDALRGEHAVFYAQFDYMETALRSGAIAEPRALGAMLAAALASHAHLEESLLFAAIEPHVGPSGLLAVMREEHDEIERLLEELPDVGDSESAKRQLAGIIALAREHFAKEEEVLFGMAAQVLTAESLTALGRQWADQRSVMLT